ncbi:hypothetical protein KSS94_15965 [Pseudomonas fakonensis]|uniref:Uncharacterized protein n=1 Tax=Pseudomonas fakonensis TaxID=2842355 RepID=A0ABX8MZ83_9PSED|nr:hypothetical protein [Pseudomonas fakonensis]QXH49445.1 hypothetical protein KSS94_15965 [Pseudomonas fakonensis]
MQFEKTFITAALLTLAAAMLHHNLRAAKVRKWAGLALLGAGVLAWSFLPQGLYLGVEWFIWVPFLVCTGSGLFVHRNRHRDND